MMMNTIACSPLAFIVVADKDADDDDDGDDDDDDDDDDDVAVLLQTCLTYLKVLCEYSKNRQWFICWFWLRIQLIEEKLIINFLLKKSVYLLAVVDEELQLSK